MSRPALIVGLGGTGQWVLTWLKRDLLLANNNELPDNVKLLSIDTATQLEAGVRSVAGRQEETVKIGGVTLQSGEFVYVGGDSRPLAEQVKHGALSNIGQWYHAQRWLDTLNPATFILDDGAGRIRQFGRIAVFKDVLGQETNSRIWRALRNAIEGVRRQVDSQRKLEILVVGSFAGGTGSGMFIDVALILRLLADQLGVHHVLRGFFALPNVFTAAPDEEMKARTFAAWRELNRFMVVNSDFPMPQIEYVQNNPRFRINPTQRIFDACYLVDSRRAGTPIAAEAKYGVHPMVAEVISAILDEHAGTIYSQHISTNLAPEYSRTPDIPLYSALGSFTVQVPAHYKQEVSTLDFTRDLLLAILAPQERNLSLSSGAERHLQLAAPDQNQEVGRGVPGRSRCHELLISESISYKGETAQPTIFTARVAEVVEQAVEDNRRATIIDQLARAGTKESRASWLPHFTNLGNDPQFEQLRRNLQGEVRYSFITSYERREGQSAHEVRANFKRIPEDMRRRYGGLTVAGTEVHGSFGERLSESQYFHLTLLRQLVRVRLLDMLMGRSDQDPLKAKSGKLGYAWDYFDGLVNLFEDFLTLMDEVKARREELKPDVKLQGILDNTRRMMDKNPPRKWFGMIEPPGVKQSEDNFLRTQQRVADLRKEHLLHHIVVETAREMKAICVSTRDMVQRWIWHLSTGDDAKGISGLANHVLSTKKSVEDDHSFDTTTPAVQKLIADNVQPVDNQEIAVALRQWEWLADYEGNPTQLVLRAQINPEAAGEQALTLTDPTSQVTAELRRQMAQQNQRYLQRLARRRFQGTAARTTVAEEIKKIYPSPAQFASAVTTGAEPLFDGAVQASPRRKSNLIRIQAPPNDSYFYGENGLEGHLRKQQSLDVAKADDNYNIRVVNSENPYKLTLVRTDDLYPPEHFTAWEECQLAYASHLSDEGDPQDPVLMHNFSAEAQAVRYEREFVEEGQTFSPLHPRLVMLLENPHALNQFLYFGMLGMVKQQTVQQLHRWELTWQRGNRPQTFWLTRGWNKQKDGTSRPQPDIMNAIHGYAILGVTWQPSRQDKIDYEFADRLIKEQQRQLGPEKEINMLQHHLESGFIGTLKSQAYDPSVPDRVVREDFADLARVAEKILQRRINELTEQQKPGKGEFIFGISGQQYKELEPKSRVEKLLENGERVFQFLYLGLFGTVQPKQDRHGSRWELVLNKRHKEEVYWLTPSWQPLRDAGRTPPGFIEALEGYVLIGHSQQPSFEDPIDYEFAALQIRERQQEMGPQREIELLEGQVNSGFVAWLKVQAYDPNVPGRIANPDFAELHKAAKQMFNERVEELKRMLFSQQTMPVNPFAFGGPSGGSATPAFGAPKAVTPPGFNQPALPSDQQNDSGGSTPW